MNSKELIEDFLRTAEQNKKMVEDKFLFISLELLTKKPNPNSWSAAECFQHLIFTNQSYLESFRKFVGENKIDNASSAGISIDYKFKHSFWGKFILYFVKPSNKIKSKTTKPFNPSFSKVELDVVKKYLTQHEQLVDAVIKMRAFDLKNIKIPSPINNKIKYNLGDSIRIIILHDQRHIQQAERAINY